MINCDRALLKTQAGNVEERISNILRHNDPVKYAEELSNLFNIRTNLRRLL